MGPIETTTEQAERHHRTTREALSLLPDLMAAQASTDPTDLLDQLEEAVTAEQHARVRKMGPVIVERLRLLAKEEHQGAQEAWSAAASQLRAYRQRHPSLNQQLKRVEEELRSVEFPIARKYQRAVDFFKIGTASKQGIRL